MNYTEEDIRDAFKAGLTKGKHQSYFDAPLDEEEYIEELKRVKNNFVLADVSFECTHENTEFKHIRCNVCTDCGELVEIDV